jgi:hypothetical protein
MPNYRVGNEPLQIRKSFREVLCELCGKSMGRIYVHTIREKREGLSPEDVASYYPFMKLDIRTHEKDCPALKKEDGPATVADPTHEPKS